MDIKDKKKSLIRPILVIILLILKKNLKLLRSSPIPDNEISENSNLYVTAHCLKRQLFFNELYKLSLDVHGDIGLFGVRWGREFH